MARSKIEKREKKKHKLYAIYHEKIYTNDHPEVKRSDGGRK
jgi:hypothetical protein